MQDFWNTIRSQIGAESENEFNERRERTATFHERNFGFSRNNAMANLLESSNASTSSFTPQVDKRGTVNYSPSKDGISMSYTVDEYFKLRKEERKEKNKYTVYTNTR